MELFVFRSLCDMRLLAVTADQTGGNLPGEFGTWRWLEDDTILSVVEVAKLGDLKTIAAAIKELGFYIAVCMDVTPKA